MISAEQLEFRQPNQQSSQCTNDTIIKMYIYIDVCMVGAWSPVSFRPWAMHEISDKLCRYCIVVINDGNVIKTINLILLSSSIYMYSHEHLFEQSCEQFVEQ